MNIIKQKEEKKYNVDYIRLKHIYDKAKKKNVSIKP